MNPTAILALLSDLYGQVAALGEENAQLRKALAEREQPKVHPNAEPAAQG